MIHSVRCIFGLIVKCIYFDALSCRLTTRKPLLSGAVGAMHDARMLRAGGKISAAGAVITVNFFPYQLLAGLILPPAPSYTH